MPNYGIAVENISQTTWEDLASQMTDAGPEIGMLPPDSCQGAGCGVECCGVEPDHSCP